MPQPPVRCQESVGSGVFGTLQVVADDESSGATVLRRVGQVSEQSAEAFESIIGNARSSGWQHRVLLPSRINYEKKTAVLTIEYPYLHLRGTTEPSDVQRNVLQDFQRQGISITHEELASSLSLPEAECVHILHAVVEHLAVLHRADVVHGNLKRNNVAVLNDTSKERRRGEEQKVLLLDYALWALENEGRAIGQMLSKAAPWWLAPELQAMSGELSRPLLPTKQADVWNLGLLAIELANGRLPLRRYDAEVASYLIRECSTPDVGVIIPGTSAGYRAFTQACLSKDLGSRPVSACALLNCDIFASEDLPRSPTEPVLEPLANDDFGTVPVVSLLHAFLEALEQTSLPRPQLAALKNTVLQLHLEFPPFLPLLCRELAAGLQAIGAFPGSLAPVTSACSTASQMKRFLAEKFFVTTQITTESAERTETTILAINKAVSRHQSKARLRQC
ncbi:Serine/threonine-protein kinase dst4 [Diplonema papillatum]|nr:Serine/threonine-protein kinase dst4 [Diplonema papillatum]